MLREVNEVVFGTYSRLRLSSPRSRRRGRGCPRPTYLGGLGFGLKWNMGWMHDTLAYFSRDPVYRSYHQGEADLLASSTPGPRNFVLTLSHDEVVHTARAACLTKMPGDRWQQLANLRGPLLYAWMWAHPGKQMLFMGAELRPELGMGPRPEPSVVDSRRVGQPPPTLRPAHRPPTGSYLGLSRRCGKTTSPRLGLSGSTPATPTQSVLSFLPPPGAVPTGCGHVAVGGPPTLGGERWPASPTSRRSSATPTVSASAHPRGDGSSCSTPTPRSGAGAGSATPARCSAHQRPHHGLPYLRRSSILAAAVGPVPDPRTGRRLRSGPTTPLRR